MATGPKSESEWDAGSLILSRESTGVADATGAASTSSASTARFPELPNIQGGLLLDVNTHRTLRSEGTNAFSDNERLSEVGEMALNLAVTNYLYHKQPVIEAIGMPVSTTEFFPPRIVYYPAYQAERCTILSDENFERWTKHYGLLNQLRYDAKQSVDLNTPRVMLFAF